MKSDVSDKHCARKNASGTVACKLKHISPHIAPSFIMPAMAALGLTGMESRVAVLLAEGMNVTEVVAATGRSPGADGASRRESAPALP